jgi:membrane protease YdiL (CAAX protease family)
MDTDLGSTRRLGLSGKLVGWFALVGVISAISYAGRFAGGKPPKNALYQWSTAISELVLFAIILGIVFVIARGLPKRDAFALRRPRSWGQAVGLAFGGLFVVAIANAVFSPLHGGREQGLTPSGWEPQHAAPFAVNLLAFAIIGPIAEELTFRGLGFYLLESFLSQAATIVVLGIMFGLWHGLVEALPVLVVFGLSLAYLRSRTRSTYPGMILHACFNAAALLTAVV